jgi:hypothetical protein
MAIAESSKEVGYGEKALLVSPPNLSHSTSDIFLFAAPWLLLRAARRWDMERRRCLSVHPTSHTLTLTIDIFICSAVAIAESSKELGYGEEAVLVSALSLLHSDSYKFLFAAPWLSLRAARRWDMERRRCLLVRSASCTQTLKYFYLQRHGYC